MANRSTLTRKEQVLARLTEAKGEWVNGSELATAAVGGSEGLKRLREARAEGWPIEDRRHPHGDRDVWQYRLASLDVRGATIMEIGRQAPEQVIPQPPPSLRCPSCDATVTGKPTVSPDVIEGRCWSCRKPFTIRRRTGA
jgi:hypothetical protein